MITVKKTDFSDIDFAAGQVILIDKSIGDTSFDVVYKVRKAVGVKKVGHAGTLDPRATGLLIVCTGKKTKEIFRFQDLSKTYFGKITLGKSTFSYDAESDFSSERGIVNVTPEKVLAARDMFLGDIEQIPPMYSALKHKGKALYKYARKGEEVIREPRKVTIYSFDILDINLPEVSFRIECSKGTYIRSIANDLGEKLECGGYLSELRREKIGDYSVDEAFNIHDFVDLTAKKSVNVQ
ncbi:MAG: tRNA pseudouridine(55) synthase TruB [Melioribacteraceae bacterium]|nr:tRNA pseudouridine(55) synthase TruB [Melioribacteraceae bacterium]MCF8263974.1 tRNA pseudouridine(55) synthase TruB [Melioribacteraceae bacterium]MCF8411826.1 tRNA pseudouridine(55) synthase TruB [Melioribacteraceae bacterium]MCF8432604.1 tRNA pseudouridine(55) synthase TruB [Melioribacteraceae bacterium]